MAAAPAPERPHALAPLLVTILLLLVGLTVNGAFAIRHWAPIGVFVLAVLVAVKRRQVSGPPLVALLAVWAFAGWTFACCVQFALECRSGGDAMGFRENLDRAEQLSSQRLV